MIQSLIAATVPGILSHRENEVAYKAMLEQEKAEAKAAEVPRDEIERIALNSLKKVSPRRLTSRDIAAANELNQRSVANILLRAAAQGKVKCMRKHENRPYQYWVEK